MQRYPDGSSCYPGGHDMHGKLIEWASAVTAGPAPEAHLCIRAEDFKVKLQGSALQRSASRLGVANSGFAGKIRVSGAKRFPPCAAFRRRRVSFDGRSAQDVPDHVGMAPFEQLAQHLWLLVPALVIWFGPAAGRRWLSFLRDLREFRAGR
jgi:hypothetical protein